jgi:hypothetical protein
MPVVSTLTTTLTFTIPLKFLYYIPCPSDLTVECVIVIHCSVRHAVSCEHSPQSNSHRPAESHRDLQRRLGVHAQTGGLRYRYVILPCPVCTPDVTWHMPYVTCHIILEVLFSSLIKISHPFLLTSLTFSYLLCSRNLYSLTFLHFSYLVSPSSLLLSSLVLSSLFAACLQPRSPATLSRTEQLSNTQKPW